MNESKNTLPLKVHNFPSFVKKITVHSLMKEIELHKQSFNYPKLRLWRRVGLGQSHDL